MRDLAAALRLLVPIALVLGALLSLLRNQSAILRRVARDDWRGVRDAASAIVDRPNRWTPPSERQQALRLLGLAHLVLGDLPQARVVLEQAVAADLPAPLHAAAVRQLASARRVMGDLDEARRLLDALDPSGDGLPQPYLDVQLALLLLGAGDAAGAAEAADRAVVALAQQRDAARTTTMQRAISADVAQATCVQVRALLALGSVDQAAERARTLTPPDQRPYLLGQVHDAHARVAIARGELAVARDELDGATGCFTSVGARIELARTGVLRALLDGDGAGLDRVEADLRALGALGYLFEVDDARRALGGGQ